jgi:threonine dehydratase
MTLSPGRGEYGISWDLVECAQSYLQNVLITSPCELSPAVSEVVGREVWLKLELMLPTRSFKVRGALFKVKQLSEGDSLLVAGLVTASTGNHGLGLAYAGRVRGVPVTVFVPRGANQAKIRAMKALGATIVERGADWQDAYECAKTASLEDGSIYVHSFDDPEIIAGQSTVGLEIAAQVPDLDTVVVPIGGGGLIAGVATALAERLPNVCIVGVQPVAGDSMRQSIAARQLVTLPPFTTIADGLAARRPGELTFQIASRLVSKVVVVQEATLRKGMALLLGEERLLVEPSGAASVAALMEVGDSIPGDRVVCVISGGNVDPTLLRALVTDAEAGQPQT